MIEVFKIMNGWERVQENNFLRRDESGRKGHTHKLFKTRVRLDVAKLSFGNRICERWNHLPDDVVSSSTVNICKGTLDNYLRTLGDLNKISTLPLTKSLVRFAHANLPMRTE